MSNSPRSACKLTVSGAISLPSPGCFSPFPHGTGSLSVAQEYLGLEGGPPSFPPGCSCPVVLRVPLEPVLVSRTGLSPRLGHLSRCFRYHRRSHIGALQPRRDMSPRFALIRVRSPLLAESRLISLPPGTEMFHFPGLASTSLWIRPVDDQSSWPGFPIRTPPDQRSLSTSPELFAAGHVLHRLCAPRHPPSALSSLTTHNRSRPGLEDPVPGPATHLLG